ncbi:MULTISPECIES: peroxiredoxin [Prochlorococcus]|uniref:Peroxiredoxin n=1 Tax=Prochlorococcus marinus (strain SARG / CCMP1375 / SS120) TaxID=167539 RepID=Q7VC10_PROMA|nr:MULTISPECIES: peroxiredoxin [Prochlorococcus]AAP99976.1 Peroxiredoxin [Prochlorococcus marinus subsp. marinus str. CCMP1375]KGG13774.1 Alkyl hydroperoxide reductase subunit C-like protein [Prochlorococcus marinus str. LG]KGG18909.1 Alkyl hydroperoxide reductase subunit C-like protein [Prochlorococcus marinus str. SS2]KGG23553.1 Alkyl hydroperoxide reductase subunit C-like protein [Prochlorococcus marinus str. SS35]KGG32211.1 Alkyl hydroperoxide reductase subunit C-like protein [Prochlorococ
MVINYIKNIIFILIFAITITSYPSIVFSNSVPNINEQAPGFELEGYNPERPDKTKWSSNDFKGSWLILYFYPEDATSGCTIEAKGFQRLNKEFLSHKANIVGISKDSKASHKLFCSDQKLDFTLLSDKDSQISKSFGSWQEGFSSRNTFLIDPNGIIKYRWLAVIPIKHAKEVLSVLNRIDQT